MMTDPIADMLTRIRNANMAHHRSVLIPSSKTKVAMARILKEEGYIQHFDVNRAEPQPMLRIILRYDENRRPVITGLKRISKPGRRIYTKRQSIPRVRSGLGTAILSTSRGVMTGKKARQLNTGGEVLCYVW